MIRDVMEKGISSLVARWMLGGSADALLDRVGTAGVLSEAEMAKLRADTRKHLQKVEAEGAPYAEVALTALKEVAKVVPLAGAIASADARGLAAKIAAAAGEVVAQSARQAAERAQDFAAAAAARAASAAASAQGQAQGQAQTQAQDQAEDTAADDQPAKEG